MRANITIMNSSFGSGDGAIEFQNGEFVFFLKSIATRLLFGAIGAALASGKEVCRFTVEDLQSYELKEKALSKTLKLNLKDGRFIVFGLKKDVSEAIMPALQSVPQA